MTCFTVPTARECKKFKHIQLQQILFEYPHRLSKSMVSPPSLHSTCIHRMTKYHLYALVISQNFAAKSQKQPLRWFSEPPIILHLTALGCKAGFEAHFKKSANPQWVLRFYHKEPLISHRWELQWVSNGVFSDRSICSTATGTQEEFLNTTWTTLMFVPPLRSETQTQNVHMSRTVGKWHFSNCLNVSPLIWDRLSQ